MYLKGEDKGASKLQMTGFCFAGVYHLFSRLILVLTC